MGNSTGYGYVNARIHGMRSYLLEKATYDTLLSLGSTNDLVDFLRKTPYREILEAELLLGDRVTAIERALTRYFASQCNKILRFTRREPHRLFQLLFWRWELDNVKQLIYQIITSKTPPTDWKDKLIPIKGYLAEAIGVLDSIETLEALQDWLATRQSPLVGVIRELRRAYPTELRAEMVETAFDNHYFDQLMTTLESLRATKSVRVFKEMISAEIEFKNIRTALRLLALSVRDKISPELRVKDLFIQEGIDTRVESLLKAFLAEKLAEVYSICQRSRYGKFLVPTFSKQLLRTQFDTIDLEMETAFIRHQIQSTKKNFQGIGLGLAFYWNLVAEIRNLRFLSQVVFSDYPREEARRFLIID